MDERRKSKRLPLDVNVEIERLDNGDGITTVKFANVKVKDMSKSGIGFETKVPLEIGSYYNAKITIWTKEKIETVLEVVRCNKVGDEYDYGATFVGMPDADAVKIEIYQLFEENLGK
ncbi:PilZ domain-containing protein [Eubacterium oxidoreducens]|uniref:PilZ domain-containing protein n=1 Tax=Eubacterium oxidoreducens TaxID=1732 RepID=A0A1G6AKN2_EUBOX|nr:PilZ domain-containing protein [Eubacterium oxidoreducens]SDB08998.1 PilZ domain-containing protein [Eubacterium oxidoreducens]